MMAKPLWREVDDFLGCPPEHLPIEWVHRDGSTEEVLAKWWEPPNGTCVGCEATPAQKRACWRQVLDAAERSEEVERD